MLLLFQLRSKAIDNVNEAVASPDVLGEKQDPHPVSQQSAKQVRLHCDITMHPSVAQPNWAGGSGSGGGSRSVQCPMLFVVVWWSQA